MVAMQISDRNAAVVSLELSMGRIGFWLLLTSRSPSKALSGTTGCRIGPTAALMFNSTYFLTDVSLRSFLSRCRKLTRFAKEAHGDGGTDERCWN